MRRWSVLRWPVAFAAMSDITPSAGPPSHSRSLSGASGVVEVHHPEFDARDRLDLEEVDADDAALALGGLDFARGDLAPAARRRAEIDDPPARLEELVFLRHLQQLVGGSRAIALALGLGDIGVVELALQPQRRGQAALARGLDPGF